MIRHHSLWWWAMHLAGVDSQQTAFYMFWSGIGPCIVGGMGVLLAFYSVRLAIRALKLENELLTAELERTQAQLDEQ